MYDRSEWVYTGPPRSSINRAAGLAGHQAACSGTSMIPCQKRRGLESKTCLHLFDHADARCVADAVSCEEVSWQNTDRGFMFFWMQRALTCSSQELPFLWRFGNFAF